MLERLRAWLTRRKRAETGGGPPDEERSSGEDAVETTEGVSAEATPSNMTRVKTDRL